MSTPESEPSPDLAALGAAWSASVEMGPMEAMMWRAEADPRLRSTITTVEILDRVPDWDRLLAAHDWASRIVPRFRQRVVEPPFGLGSPTWVTDAEVDFAYHMNRIRLSGPGTMAQLIAEAQSMAMRPFDRARPLWEAALVEGLEGGRAGYILKSHHSVSDGIGGMQVLGLLHSRTREPMVDRAEPAAPPSTARGSLEVLAEQAVHRVRNAPGEVVSLTGSALGLAGRILRRPDRAALGAARYAGSLGRVASPPAGSHRRCYTTVDWATGSRCSKFLWPTSKRQARLAAARSTTPTSRPCWVGFVATTSTSGCAWRPCPWAFPSACGGARTPSAATASPVPASPHPSGSPTRASECARSGSSS